MSGPGTPGFCPLWARQVAHTLSCKLGALVIGIAALVSSGGACPQYSHPSGSRQCREGNSMTFRLIYDGIEQNSINNRRTNQPVTWRSYSGRAQGARPRSYDTSPREQYGYPHAIIPAPPPAHYQPIPYWPLAYETHGGNAVYREVGGSVYSPRARHGRGRGNYMGARHSSSRTGANRGEPESLHTFVFRTPAGRFLSELFNSVERLSRECPSLLQSSDPVGGGSTGARGERLLAVLNVAANNRGEGAVLQANTTGGCGNPEAQHQVTTPRPNPTAAIPECRIDERGRDGEGTHTKLAVPHPHLCGRVHSEGEPCQGEPTVRYL
nr:Long Distance MP [Wild carrot mottle virus]